MSEHLFDRLRRDHRRVLAESSAIEAAVAGLGPDGTLPADAVDGLVALLALLERQFATHMRTEEEVVFPALAAALPEARPTLVPLRAEHGELRDMLAALAACVAGPAGPGRDEQLAVQVHDLADLLRIHVRKEEAVVFSIAERVLTPAEQARLDAASAGSVTPHPHAAGHGPEAPRGTTP